nr:MAG TPA: hypothetical protein [Caudoviricetes sp.]
MSSTNPIYFSVFNLNSSTVISYVLICILNIKS